jgi:cytochrome P450
MDFPYLLVASAGLILTVRIILVLFRLLSSPLRSVPGPFLARFTDGWYMWRVSKGHFELDNLALHDKYGESLLRCLVHHASRSGSLSLTAVGPIVRYGPNRFSIRDIEASNTIYGHGTKFSKSSWYSSWASPGAWSIFGDQSIKRHAQNRKLYQHTYSMTSLVTYEPYVDQCTELFSKHLARMSEAGEAVDMGHWFQCYAFDVIGLITYGRRLGFLDRGADIEGVIGALEDHLGYAALVGIYPQWHRYLYPLVNFWAGKKGSGRAYVLSFTKGRVEEYRKTVKASSVDDQEPTSPDVKAGEPFLAKFMAKHEEDPTVFTAQHITVGLAANMVAGSDTTAISLSAILYYSIVTPGCLDRLREEVNAFQAEGKLSWPPTFKESQQMPYLQAVLKEALRLHPATGLPLERVVPEGGTTIGGRFFPEGVSLRHLL